MDMTGIAGTRVDDLLLRQNPLGAIQRMPDGGQSENPERLKEAAKKFEGLFIHEILKQMKESIEAMRGEPESETDTEDSSGEHLRSMYWTFWADTLTKEGGFGLWESIYKQLSAQTGPAASAEMDEQA
jgi:Rod binding domain-containing protein